jgi:DNA ligase (NAD+)
MLAWKFKAEQVRTTVVDVVWQTGRTGKITPVAILDPVQIAGTVVGKATLHNLSEIERLNVSIGDSVLLEKAGDIIPKIVRVENATNEKRFNYPDVCPSCGVYTSNDGTHVWCNNTECGAKLLTRIDYYLKTLEIKEVGPAMIQALIDAGFVKSIVDLYYLNEEQIMSLPNSGLRTAQIVTSAILSKNEIDLATFLPALGIHGLGKTIGKLLAKKYKTIEAVRDVEVNDLVNMEGIANITANAIVNGLADCKETIDGLLNLLVVKDFETVQGVFTGKNFCCTGTLSRKRKEIQKMIADAGGEYTSIKKGLDYLIVGEGAVQKKLDKAKGYGAEVIEEEEFVKML